MFAPPQRADLRHARDFIDKPHAARTMNTPRHRRFHQRAHVFFFHRALMLVVAADARAIGHRLILQIALAGLVADRAIERVVDKQEFHHPVARLFYHWRVGEHFHFIGRRQRTRRLRLRRPRLHFHQTHAAVAGDFQPIMVTKPWNLHPRAITHLDDGFTRVEFNFVSVDFKAGHGYFLSVVAEVGAAVEDVALVEAAGAADGALQEYFSSSASITAWAAGTLLAFAAALLWP